MYAIHLTGYRQRRRVSVAESPDEQATENESLPWSREEEEEEGGGGGGGGGGEEERKEGQE